MADCDHHLGRHSPAPPRRDRSLDGVRLCLAGVGNCHLAKGAGVALLVGGPMTALPVMGILITMFRKRVLFLYLTLCIVGTLLVAMTVNYLPINL